MLRNYENSLETPPNGIGQRNMNIRFKYLFLVPAYSITLIPSCKPNLCDASPVGVAATAVQKDTTGKLTVAEH